MTTAFLFLFIVILVSYLGISHSNLEEFYHRKHNGETVTQLTFKPSEISNKWNSIFYKFNLVVFSISMVIFFTLFIYTII